MILFDSSFENINVAVLNTDIFSRIAAFITCATAIVYKGANTFLAKGVSTCFIKANQFSLMV